MSMGLKNASATYQPTMQKCLQSQIGRNVHVYVDDIVIKTKERSTLMEDIAETFANLRRYQMKLNPTKCTFSVPAGRLLGYLISARGIEANPDKVNFYVGSNRTCCDKSNDPSSLNKGYGTRVR